jgi:hypothetical protein
MSLPEIHLATDGDLNYALFKHNDIVRKRKAFFEHLQGLGYEITEMGQNNLAVKK